MTKARVTASKTVAFGSLAMLVGCGVPNFDIPSVSGAPTVATIVKRITCELTGMIREDGNYPHRTTLLTGDYGVTVQLSLDVTNSGELSPSFNFPSTPTFASNFGLKLSQSRDQNFTMNLVYSMKDLSDRSKQAKDFGSCPKTVDTNLAGDLGITETVSLALTSGFRDPEAKPEEFGGSVNFVVTRNLNSVGPTWTLQRFVGPGNLGTLSRVNNDKITFAFSPAQAGKGTNAPPEATKRSNDFLNQLLLNQISANPLK